jgi:hypothetical protein
MRANRQASTKTATASSMAKWAMGLMAVSLVALSLAVSALAAGPFDGQWKGGSPAMTKLINDKCIHSLDITITIADGAVSGVAHGGYGDHPISGKVGPDGSFRGELSGGLFTGTFSNGGFTGSFHTGAQGCAERSVNLQRAN